MFPEGFCYHRISCLMNYVSPSGLCNSDKIDMASELRTTEFRSAVKFFSQEGASTPPYPQ